MKTETLTVLTKLNNCSVNANSILAALKKTGHLELIEYPSTSGSGEIKTYERLTEDGLIYGINRSTNHDFKTEPRFYPEKFGALMRLVAMQISREAEAFRS